MIVMRYWDKYKPGKKYHCKGLFLFGFIPLYLSIEVM